MYPLGNTHFSRQEVTVTLTVASECVRDYLVCFWDRAHLSEKSKRKPKENFDQDGQMSHTGSCFSFIFLLLNFKKGGHGPISTPNDP